MTHGTEHVSKHAREEGTTTGIETRWVRTDQQYRDVIDAPDDATREQRFRTHFVQPFVDFLTRMAPTGGGADVDALELVRGWHWRMPEDLRTVPDALRRLEAADAWTVAERALARGVAQFAPYADRISLRQITGWLMLANPANTEASNQGYTGAQWPGHLIVQYDTPTEQNLRCLPGAVVHELHHNIRLDLFPWNMAHTSVADYIVLEGLAESFATALYGDEVLGYYVTDLDADDLETAKRITREGLHETGFNVIRGYLFGDHLADGFGFQKVGMPPFGGYAVGYHVVQAYLRRTGRTVAEATLVPADEIVAESRYWQA